MTTIEYLGQLKNIDRRIKDKIEEADKWRQIADSRKSPALNEKVQGTRKMDKEADAYTLAADYEIESRLLAAELSKLKNCVIKQIDGIDDELFYNILKSFYIQEKSFTEIAAEEGYSYKQIKRQYEVAVKCFDEKYGMIYAKSKKLSYDVPKCPIMSD